MYFPKGRNFTSKGKLQRHVCEACVWSEVFACEAILLYTSPDDPGVTTLKDAYQPSTQCQYRQFLYQTQVMNLP